MLNAERGARRSLRTLLLIPGLLFLLPSLSFAALSTDEIVLITNSKVRSSDTLASLYATTRHIPFGHTLALDLPFPDEEMPAEMFEQQVVPKVRQFLEKNNLKEKTRCIVTFWGVPLRIRQKQNAPAANEQLAKLDRRIRESLKQVEEDVKSLEAVALELDPAFKPKPGEAPQQLGVRINEAATVGFTKIPDIGDEKERQAVFDRWFKSLEGVVGEVNAVQKVASNPSLAKLAGERAEKEKVEATVAAARELQTKLQAIRPGDSSFDELYPRIVKTVGLLQAANIAQLAKGPYDNSGSTAAFDSELSLLWQNGYPKRGWQGNPLNFRAGPAPAGQPPVLMVMRLDGPTEVVVRRIIEDSAKVEAKGLSGIVALDARGNHGNDAYAQYDNTIRSLAELLKAKTKLTVDLDDKDAVFQPGPNAPKGVAIYCGWYSLRNYVKAAEFVPGAVGFHIASSELVSLRTPGEKGWVANLLNDRVVASLGPVDEPYLHSFPRADEFFPLLLTGKLTLAEVYWKTNPLTSWMNTCIGDPLYTPYAKAPGISVADLPPDLRQVITPEAPASEVKPDKVDEKDNTQKP